jgi:uncharacterized integral membrane protein
MNSIGKGMMLQCLQPTGEVYQGHFGEFTITQEDRLGVVIYRGGLLVAALCFAAGAIAAIGWSQNPLILQGLTWIFCSFCLALGVSLMTIHIYMIALHRALQVFWAIGCGAALWIGLSNPTPLALAVYTHPLNLMGVGWVFVALTGLFFKEAFCFNRGETKLLTIVVPLLLLGHWFQYLPLQVEQGLLAAWAGLFFVFALRKVGQPIPPDIGDKSVFVYLEQVNHNLEAS